VNCEVCGTELPHGALFCGECGRAVGNRTAKTLHPDSGMPIDVAEPISTEAVHTDPRDTAIIEPVVRDKLPELESELPEPPVANEGEQHQTSDALGASPEPVAKRSRRKSTAAAPEIAEVSAADPEPAAPELAAPELAAPEPATPKPAAPEAATSDVGPQEAATPRPDPFPWGDRGSAIFSDSDEIEQTLIVPRRDTGERFVLQFSTGESVTVFGSGLLGRNPTPQPTEYFDQLVSISDPGKSVSKTHLEFGQEAGSFWVSDRFSGNGSAVREPESSPRRLVAGKRYRIVRGTRVDIGEQFFVVS
jgi:hypothetical protein